MTGIIILAAGSSSRLGRPKQNLVYKGKTLLQRTVETAVSSVGKPVMVVLGGNAEVIRPTLENYNIEIALNADWQQGMASSIRTGLTKLMNINPKIDSVILMLCDQPFVDTYLLNLLIAAKAHEGICASYYNDTVGPPVLFDAVYFDELLKLQGAEGAKKLMQQYAEKVKQIPFALGVVDIDTMEDYEKISG